MSNQLHKIVPDDTRHRGNCFWFDQNGTLYYGKDEDNLVSPFYLEDTGKLPRICVRDLVAALKIGMKLAKESSVGQQ